MRIKLGKNSRTSRAASTSAAQRLNKTEKEDKVGAIGSGISSARNITEEPITSSSDSDSGDAGFSPTPSVEINPKIKSFFRIVEVLKIKKTKQETVLPPAPFDAPSPQQKKTEISQQRQVNETKTERYALLEKTLASAQENFGLLQNKLAMLETDALEKAQLAKGLFAAKDAKTAAKKAKQKVTSQKEKMRPFHAELIALKKQLIEQYQTDMSLTRTEIEQLTRQLIQDDIEEKQRQRKNRLISLINKNKRLATAIAKFKAIIHKRR